MNLKPYLIGLTGGIASGKSSALEIFKKNNILTFDCDEKVNEIWKSDDFKTIIKNKFDLLDVEDHKLKQVVSSIVFENEARRKELEELTHPLVLKAIDKFVLENKNEQIIVIDMPLLFEIEYDKIDTTLLIYIKEQEQLKRLCQSRNLNGIQAEKLIKSQIPLSKKFFLADHVIDNSGSLFELQKNILNFIKEIKNELKKSN